MDIPTAEEFLNSEEYYSVSNDYDTQKAMIKFAKLHVEKALEAASEKAIAKENPSDYGTGEIWVDEKSILNAYPLNNIK